VANYWYRYADMLKEIYIYRERERERVKYILKCSKLLNSVHVFVGIVTLYVLKCGQTSVSKIQVCFCVDCEC